jgi:hypothetical protein
MAMLAPKKSNNVWGLSAPKNHENSVITGSYLVDYYTIIGGLKIVFLRLFGHVN